MVARKAAESEKQNGGEHLVQADPGGLEGGDFIVARKPVERQHDREQGGHGDRQNQKGREEEIQELQDVCERDPLVDEELRKL